MEVVVGDDVLDPAIVAVHLELHVVNSEDLCESFQPRHSSGRSASLHALRNHCSASAPWKNFPFDFKGLKALLRPAQFSGTHWGVVSRVREEDSPAVLTIENAPCKAGSCNLAYFYLDPAVEVNVSLSCV